MPRQARKAIWLSDIADIFANVHEPLSGVYTGDMGAALRGNQLPVCTANILQAAFSYESFLRSFSVLTIWVCNFLAKGFSTNAAHKMLVKLTAGGSIGHGHVLQLLFSRKSENC